MSIWIESVQLLLIIVIAGLCGGLLWLSHTSHTRTDTIFINKSPHTQIATTQIATVFICIFILVGCVAVQSDNEEASEETTTLTIYSGRNENLVGPLLEMYNEQSDTTIEVRYGGTAEMASAILEEGGNSPADIFYGQDAGALGVLAQTGRCVELPDGVLEQVDARFISPDKRWVGISGRARTLVYNTDELSAEDLPTSVLGLTDPKWESRVGWAPTNSSFQAFITAMRTTLGEEKTRAWLEGMLANDVQVYPKNTPIVQATGNGEISVGLVNHYYLYRFLTEDPDFPATNYHFPDGDVGSMINVAGVCLLDTADEPETALELINYLLSQAGQQYFADTTNEYPLAALDIEINSQLQPLSEIDTPSFDLGQLLDLQGTVQMLTEVGAFD